MVLVSLLVDQLSSLFLTFFGQPKKNLFSLREFLVSLWIFFGQALIFWYTKKKFWYTKKKFGWPKKSKPDQKFPETEQIFFWSTKKSEKKTGQLVDQETDQNHMDGTNEKNINCIF